MDSVRIAFSLGTSPETLERLATDNHPDVRCGVAWNPNTTSKVLTRLANDKDSGVRESVARNPNTPIATLELIAIAENTCWVRNNIVWNPNTPQYIKTYLKIKKFLNCYE